MDPDRLEFNRLEFSGLKTSGVEFSGIEFHGINIRTSKLSGLEFSGLKFSGIDINRLEFRVRHSPRRLRCRRGWPHDHYEKTRRDVVTREINTYEERMRDLNSCSFVPAALVPQRMAA